jgi:hypothetical protein
LRQGYDFVDSNEDIDVESPEEDDSFPEQVSGEAAETSRRDENKETLQAGDIDEPKSLDLMNSRSSSRVNETNKTNNERINTIKSQNRSEDKLIIKENQF